MHVRQYQIKRKSKLEKSLSLIVVILQVKFAKIDCFQPKSMNLQFQINVLVEIFLQIIEPLPSNKVGRNKSKKTNEM